MKLLLVTTIFLICVRSFAASSTGGAVTPTVGRIAGKEPHGLLAPTPSVAEKTATDAQHIDVLRDRLLQLAQSFPGKVGLHVRNLETGTEVAINADELFPLASIYKIPMMVQVFRDAEAGRLKLNERVTLTDEDKRFGSGLFRYFSPGLDPTIHDLMLLMITVSDNEATDLLLKRVGVQNVTATLRQLGLRDVTVDRSTKDVVADWMALADPKFRERSLASILGDEHVFDQISPEQLDRANRAFAEDKRDHGSARAINDLLTKIFRSEAASEKSCRDMLDIMKQQLYRDGIPRYLNDAIVANKTGQIGYTTNDAAIVYAGKQHLALTVFTLRANESVTVEEVNERIAKIARIVVDYFQDTSVK